MSEGADKSSRRGIGAVHVLLALGTLLIPVIKIIVDRNVVLDQEFVLLPWGVATTTLCALQSIPPRAKWRPSWMAASLGCCVLATAALFIHSLKYYLSMKTLLISFPIIFGAPALAVPILRGPIRFLLATFNHQTPNEDRQFGVKHLLYMMVGAAVLLTVARLVESQQVRVVFIANGTMVCLIAGALLQDQRPTPARLSAAAALAMGVGVVMNWCDKTFADFGGVRMNAIQLAIMTAWLWGPQLWDKYVVPRAPKELGEPAA